MTTVFDDGTARGTLENLASLLNFLAASAANEDICDPGLHLAILQASVLAQHLNEQAIFQEQA
ncbi:hypothetical protein [Veronia pacifica]|uniref:Uncharacterized protein n=1 Tax=Veronia pacifica TaxID=1080227 RepID=A0A1C3EBL1_9GAMM|nr:hypothetical protein [Veronia pacifica]ODA30636.1 hypothetical protein A8L45_19725 [Veronia pacifica]